MMMGYRKDQKPKKKSKWKGRKEGKTKQYNPSGAYCI
jgi:hypothetical protein